MLTDSGFAAVEIAECRQPFVLGADTDDAFEFVRGVGVVQGLLEDLDPRPRAAALENLPAATIAARETPNGVAFGSAAWLIAGAACVIGHPSTVAEAPFAADQPRDEAPARRSRGLVRCLVVRYFASVVAVGAVVPVVVSFGASTTGNHSLPLISTGMKQVRGAGQPA